MQVFYSKQNLARHVGPEGDDGHERRGLGDVVRRRRRHRQGPPAHARAGHQPEPGAQSWERSDHQKIQAL